MEDENNNNETQPKIPFYKTKKGILIIIGSICAAILLIGGITALLTPSNTNYETSNSEDDTGYFSTAILTAKEVQLDKNTFSDPVNRDKLFEIRLVKHDLKQLEFAEIKKATYDNYLNDNNDYINDIVKKEQKTINGTTGYLLTINNEYTNTETFSFIFEKNGVYYEISSTDGDITWDSIIENDISILLSAWLSKLPENDSSSNTQTTETTSTNDEDYDPRDDSNSAVSKDADYLNSIGKYRDVSGNVRDLDDVG